MSYSLLQARARIAEGLSEAEVHNSRDLAEKDERAAEKKREMN